MPEQPSGEVLRRLYGDPPHALDATIEALRARRAHLDALIVMLQAEQAMRQSPPPPAF